MRVASNWNSLTDDGVAMESLGSFKRAIHCCMNVKLFHFVSLSLLK